MMAKVNISTGFDRNRVLNGKTVTYVGVTSNVKLVYDALDFPRIRRHRGIFRRFATNAKYKDLKFDNAAIQNHIGILCIYCWGPVGQLLEHAFQRVIEHKGGLVSHDTQMLGAKKNSEIHLLMWPMQTCTYLNVIPARVYQVMLKVGKVNANAKIKFSRYAVGLLGTRVKI